MKPVLVTGCAGFVGYHIAQRCLREGLEVIGVDNLNDYYDVGLKRARLRKLDEATNFTFHRLDLLEGPGLNTLFQRHRFGVVYHMAAQAGVRYSLSNPQAYIDSNLVGFSNILEACRHWPVDHLIYASSSSVYGANAKLPFSTRDNVDHPVSLYAATKKANEVMAHAYAHLFSIPCTGVRFFTVYGPWGRPDMAVYLFTQAITRNEPIDVFAGGELRRDFTYIDDVIEALWRLRNSAPRPDTQWNALEPDPATSAAPYAIFNIGNHTPITVNTLISAIETCVGKKAVIRSKPMQPGDVEATYADVAALSAAVGFAPATPIERGVGEFVRWFNEYTKSPAPLT